MYRLFNTHNVRKVQEISGLWDFKTEDGSFDGKITVPSCWEVIPSLASYKGKATYSKNLTLGGNVRLSFKGVSHSARVFVDGNLVTEHYNAYTPFYADVKLEYGNHEISVEVDNAYSENSALHVENDYYTYGGITRPVLIEQLGNANINYIHFIPEFKQDTWSSDISIGLQGNIDENKEYTLKIYLGDKLLSESDVVLNGREFKIINECCAVPDVIPYTPDVPKLYELSAVLYCGDEPIDDLIDRVGFREITTHGKKLLLNGKPLRLCGFNRHEDYNCFGSSIPLQAMMRDMALIKETGANAVRTCHYPNDEIFLDLCDEMGIFVWEEGHARGLSEDQMRNPNFIPQSLNCIDEMIMNHINHPSIFCWGILNECVSETEFGRSCYKTLFDRITSLDTSRPKTFASNRFTNDICFDLVDIVSVNIYPGWYDNEVYSTVAETIEACKNYARKQSGEDKPFIISEIGAGAVYGYRSDTCCKWSEDYQAKMLDEQLSASLENEDVNGVFIWQFCDARVDESWFYSRPKCNNNKGIVDEYRRKKLSYDVVKRHFLKK